MDLPQQHEGLFPGSPSHTADAPCGGASAFRVPASQHPQSEPFSDHHPLLEQAHAHAGVQRDAVAQPQDPDYTNMPVGYYGMANDYLPPHGNHDHIICDDARIAQDLPAQAQVIPPAPAISAFDNEAHEAAAGHTAAFLGEMPHLGPVPNEWASEVLRQLANLYVNDPNSKVAAIHMEPDHADEVTVVISLKVTNL